MGVDVGDVRHARRCVGSSTSSPSTGRRSTIDPVQLEQPGDDADVADLRDVAQPARLLPEQRRHHRLGDEVLGPAHRDGAAQRGAAVDGEDVMSWAHPDARGGPPRNPGDPPRTSPVLPLDGFLDGPRSGCCRRSAASGLLGRRALTARLRRGLGRGLRRGLGRGLGGALAAALAGAFAAPSSPGALAAAFAGPSRPPSPGPSWPRPSPARPWRAFTSRFAGRLGRRPSRGGLRGRLRRGLGRRLRGRLDRGLRRQPSWRPPSPGPCGRRGGRRLHRSLRRSCGGARRRGTADGRRRPSAACSGPRRSP